MIDLLALVKRDHHDLESALDELLAAPTMVELRSALDCVRLGLTAHAEAEDIVLEIVSSRHANVDELRRIIGYARTAHLTQEGALAALVCTTPGTDRWRRRVVELREMVRDHGTYEEANVIPALRELAADVYDGLAGRFATERLRQLAMLQPSAPIYVPTLALAG
jgi:hypothetical protein